MKVGWGREEYTTHCARKRRARLSGLGRGFGNCGGLMSPVEREIFP
jgi:hypothetical protein